MTRKIILTILAGILVTGFLHAQYSAENVAVPYILRAPEPITVDGNLDEWGFAFPLVLKMLFNYLLMNNYPFLLRIIMLCTIKLAPIDLGKIRII